MSTVDLQKLMDEIHAGFPFIPSRYPNADLSTPELTRAFAVAHSAKHMAKTTGQISAESERYDHGGRMNGEALRIATAKSVVNALNLANALSMDAEEIARLVPEVMRT